MSELIDLLQENKKIEGELKDLLTNAQTLPYYDVFNRQSEKRKDIDSLLDTLHDNQKDRVQIIELLIKKLKNEKNELLKKL